MKTIAAAGLSALLALPGCAAVKVNPLHPDAGTKPRPRDCAVEFLPKAPERAYDELAELGSHVTSVPPGGPLEVLREPACLLGADAVVVSRNFVINYLGHVMVAGTAIRYRAEPAPPPPEAGQPPPSEVGQAPQPQVGQPKPPEAGQQKPPETGPPLPVAY